MKNCVTLDSFLPVVLNVIEGAMIILSGLKIMDTF